eukprot:6206747-Pleurochrysis_carterae.AAC.6
MDMRQSEERSAKKVEGRGAWIANARSHSFEARDRTQSNSRESKRRQKEERAASTPRKCFCQKRATTKANLFGEICPGKGVAAQERSTCRDVSAAYLRLLAADRCRSIEQLYPAEEEHSTFRPRRFTSTELRGAGECMVRRTLARKLRPGASLRKPKA